MSKQANYKTESSTMSDFSELQPRPSMNLTDYDIPFVYEGQAKRALHFSISAIQSRMRLDDPTALDIDYTRTMMGFMLFAPKPSALMMIGLGGGSMVKFCHARLRHARLVVAEINPHVIALRERFSIPPDDDRLSVVCADGSHLIKAISQRFDAVVVDGFDRDGQAPQLGTSVFYRDVWRALKPGGVMVVNLHTPHRMQPVYLGRITRCFRGEVATLDEYDGCNQIVFARKPLERGSAPVALADDDEMDQRAAPELRAELARVRQAWNARPPCEKWCPRSTI